MPPWVYGVPFVVSWAFFCWVAGVAWSASNMNRAGHLVPVEG